MEKAQAVRSRRGGVALLLLVMVVACGKEGPHRKTAADLKKEYGAQVEARLAKLYAAQEANQFADADVPNIVVHVDTDTLVAESDDLTTQTKVRNTDKYDEKSRPGLLTLDESQVFIARSLVGSEEGYISDSSEPTLEQVLDAKYVLIVHTQWDQYGGAKPLGKFDFTATNSDELTTHTYNGGNGQTNDAQRVLRSDFVKQYRAAIANGIKTRWPGSSTGAL